MAIQDVTAEMQDALAYLEFHTFEGLLAAGDRESAELRTLGQRFAQPPKARASA